jgi:dephospho-CoA kinase
MAPPGPIFQAIVREFGQSIVGLDGSIDRRKLGAIVFSDPRAIRRLDAIVHPEASSNPRRDLLHIAGKSRFS